MSGFINDDVLRRGPWQAFQRSVARLMICDGFDQVRIVNRSGDEGADILASKNGKRWVIQVKFRKNEHTGKEAVAEVLNALHVYRAEIPVIAMNGVRNQGLMNFQKELLTQGINLQIWDRTALLNRFNKLPEKPVQPRLPRPYQEAPIKEITSRFLNHSENHALAIMATGLGKTYVAAESLRRIIEGSIQTPRVLILAHSNELVYQLERNFSLLMPKKIVTSIWNGLEPFDFSNDTVITFGCVNSVVNEIQRTGGLPISFDIVIIDESHHAGSSSYQQIISHLRAGAAGGPFLLGLTATPWRGDYKDIRDIFGEPVCSIDIIQGMREGYLANVDYRLYLNNINWQALGDMHAVTPRSLNRSLFIEEWDEGVIDMLQQTWSDVVNPKAIIFCQTIQAAINVCAIVNSRAFTSAEILYSGSYNGKLLTPVERATRLNDFADGRKRVLCAVDILNEGIDVPDVNIIVFQRTTHSRRIFVQQLGRGLRVKEGKDTVIVLDFVSDIRRIAAGLELKDGLKGSQKYLRNVPVKFMRHGQEDMRAESFFRKWLEDVATVEDAGEDDVVLKYPPIDEFADLLEN